ncbi:MAG: hypothetical protein JWQ96_1861 [Segetibacter sp.]|nr:hypothetical protein [Segetibacter sp.]
MEVVSEVFVDPRVSRDIVVNTKQVKVIFRFIYVNEDMREVMTKWLKIEGLDL